MQFHGGGTPRGIASPNTVTGKDSLVLPHALLPRYADAMRDPELLSLRSRIATTDARIAQMMQMMRDGLAPESEKMWQAIREAEEHLRRLVETELKRLKDLRQTITVEQAMLLVRVLLDSVKRNVPDQDALRRISEDVSVLITVPAKQLESGE